MDIKTESKEDKIGRKAFVTEQVSSYLTRRKDSSNYSSPQKMESDKKDPVFIPSTNGIKLNSDENNGLGKTIDS